MFPTQKRFLGITYVQTIYASSTNENTFQQATDQVSEILRKQHKLPADRSNDDFSVRAQAEPISTMNSTSQLLLQNLRLSFVRLRKYFSDIIML